MTEEKLYTLIENLITQKELLQHTITDLLELYSAVRPEQGVKLANSIAPLLTQDANVALRSWLRVVRGN